MTNAFTAPRKPFFTDKELATMRTAEGGRKGGQARHKNDGGKVWTTSRIKPDEFKK